MKVIAGDHIEAMLLDIRELLLGPPSTRTIREIVDAHTIDMPDVVERKWIEKLDRNKFIPSWEPEAAHDPR